MRIIFLDTETTGIADGRLVQLAYRPQAADAANDANSIVVEYFKPPVPIEIEAMAVHHITEKHVADKPAFEGSAAKVKIQELLGGDADDSAGANGNGAILVAHNAKFDIGVLEREGVRVGRYICTMKIAQTMYDLPMYKMQYLRYLWGIENDEATAHDAEGDVIILEKVFEHMVREYAAKNGVSEAEAIEKFIEISANPILLKQIPFGKHAGKTFEEVLATDPSYLQWMATLTDKGEDFAYTVNYYLGK
jgi:DNA polymerase III epsilon subunit-like protein